MANAEFSEREFELSACLELAEGARRGSIFTIGQVLEGLLGYDALAQLPPGHPIWNVLGVRRPKGVRLAPTYWPRAKNITPAAFPAIPISLVLQFKRPEFLRTSNSLQWRQWEEPYFRFETRQPQQQILARLEKKLGGDALVRYAAPVFWRSYELETAFRAGRIVNSLGVVSPRKLNRHKYWTYLDAGSFGFANPSRKEVAFPTLDEALARLVPPRLEPAHEELELSPQRRFQKLFSQLGGDPGPIHWRGVASGNTIRRWRHSLERLPGLSVESIDAIEGFAYLSTLVSRAGAVWFVVDASRWLEVG
jgi:hypothetical protein